MAQVCSLNIMTSQKTKDYHVQQETFTEWLFRMAAKQGFTVPCGQPPLNKLEALATEVANGLGPGEVLAPFVECLRKVVTLRKEVAAVFSQEANHQADGEDGHGHAIGVFERILAVFDAAMTRDAAASEARRAEMAATMHQPAIMHQGTTMHHGLSGVQQHFDMAARAAYEAYYINTAQVMDTSARQGYGVYDDNAINYGISPPTTWPAQDAADITASYAYPAYGNYAPMYAAPASTAGVWQDQGHIDATPPAVQQTKAGSIGRAADGCWVPLGPQTYQFTVP